VTQVADSVHYYAHEVREAMGSHTVRHSIGIAAHVC